MNKYWTVLWSYGREGAALSGVVSAVGTAVLSLVGGWDQPLKALLLFMLLDFILGVLAAAKHGEVDSKIAFWGGVNKLEVLCFVMVGVMLDGTLPLDEPYCRTAVIFFYMAREGLSLIENYGKLGGELPAFLCSMLAQMKNQYDKGE